MAVASKVRATAFATNSERRPVAAIGGNARRALSRGSVGPEMSGSRGHPVDSQCGSRPSGGERDGTLAVVTITPSIERGGASNRLKSLCESGFV
jgi:hypothetical protein